MISDNFRFHENMAHRYFSSMIYMWNKWNREYPNQGRLYSKTLAKNREEYCYHPREVSCCKSKWKLWICPLRGNTVITITISYFDGSDLEHRWLGEAEIPGVLFDVFLLVWMGNCDTGDTVFIWNSRCWDYIVRVNVCEILR